MQDSPYTPGAGHRPPILAGRDDLVHAWELMLNSVETRGRVRASDTILAGPRGIGKTVTALEFGDLSRDSHYEIVNLQAAARNATLIDSLVRQAQRRADAGAGPWQRAKRAFERIAAINVNVAGVGGGISTHQPDTTPHPVAPEDLADALGDLAHEVQADHPGGGVLITIDEMQVAVGPELALLAAALQRLNTDRADAHVLFAGTALPHIADVLEAAQVTHPDRLFRIHQLPLTLSNQDALYAIVKPAQDADAAWQPEAADLIVATTNAHPAHLQLFADHAWTTAQGPTITLEDAHQAVHSARIELEERTLEPRTNRLSDRQTELLCAIAAHGGRASTSDITITLGRASSSEFSRTRDELLTKGEIYAPSRAEMALTVPLMAGYILENYENLRTRASAPVLPLEEIQRNVQAIAANRAIHEATGRPTERAASRYPPSSAYPAAKPPTRPPGRGPS